MGDGIIQKIKWLFILWLARRLPDCRQMVRRLGESLDRKTSWYEKLVIKLHLFTCEACDRYLEQIEFLSEAMHAHGEHSADTFEYSLPILSVDAKDRLKRTLRTNIGIAF